LMLLKETTCSYNVQSMYRTDCGYYGIIRAQCTNIG